MTLKRELDQLEQIAKLKEYLAECRIKKSRTSRALTGALERESQCRKELEQARELLRAELGAMLKDLVEPQEPCTAVLYHGPGHQTKTRCQKTGEHEVHECVYGSYEQRATWVGEEACTDFFDNPPQGEDL